MAPTTHQIADKTDSRKLTEFLCQQGRFLLPAEQGTAKLKKLSEWLAQEYPSAAESLLEGLTEMFTISRLFLSAGRGASLVPCRS